MKLWKKGVSVLVIGTLIANLISPMTKKVNAADDLIFLETVYVDGMEFQVNLDYENEEIVIVGEEDGQSAEMILQYDGQAEIELSTENGEVEKYEAEIENLNQKEVDIEVYEDDKIVEEYEEYEELVEDVYEGETSIGVTFSLVVGIVFCVVLSAAVLEVSHGVAKILAHVFYKQMMATDTKTKEEAKDEYYPAYVNPTKHTVYILPNGITKAQASALLKKDMDVYSFDVSHARRAITGIGSGYKAINSQGEMQPECHWYPKKYNYLHFHKGVANSVGGYKKTGSAHSLYGAPQYVS